MNKLRSRSKARGATMVEYALLLFLVMLTAVMVWRNVGAQVKTAGQRAGSELRSE